MDRLKELFGSSKVNSVYLRTSDMIKDRNFHYFTNLDTSRDFNASVLLRKGRKPLLFSNVLEFMEIANRGDYKKVLVDDRKKFAKILDKNLRGRVGLNFETTTLLSIKDLRRTAKHAKFLDVSKQLGILRSIKTKEEVKKISSACKITTELLDSVSDAVKPGMTEEELGSVLKGNAEKSGVSFSFPAIIASGEKSRSPHHVTGKTKIRSGVLLVDIGVVFENYCSDLTRMYFIGKPTDEVERSYVVVKKAQDAAISMMKDGVKSAGVFKKVNSILKAELGHEMIHSLGHGIGLDVHDFPAYGLSGGSKQVLKQDMVFAVEPAFYGSRFGIRIEDDVVVTKDGCRQLTRSPKEITLI